MRSILVALLVMLMVNEARPSSPIQDKINWLDERLHTKHYWNRNQKFRVLTTWEHMKGLYSSNVHFNIVDKINTKAVQIMRTKFRIDDVNMFVTNFVLYGLLEAEQLGTLKIDHHKFSQSLEALSNFRDKNVPYGIPQYVFWPQVLTNGTWSAKSVNLVNVLKMAPSTPAFMAPFLQKIGLGILSQTKQFLNYFVIPPDNDDSSVNIALLGFLKELNSSHYDFWHSVNFQTQVYYNQALKYAYRPFESNYSRNPRANEIDSRTYFALWKFIEQKREEAANKGETPSLILPTTWLISRDEEIKGVIVMPFDTNNVDASVCANFLFGLSYQAILGGIEMTQELKQMAINTAQLLQFVVANVVEKRPDVLLLYYPSKYDFYWFIARTVSLYKRHASDLPSPFDLINVKLRHLMHTLGTKNILQNKRRDKENGTNHWSQFLGNYGKKNRNQDALFSTALAMNALLDTWTTKQGKKVVYDQNTPGEVIDAIRGGAKYLMQYAKPKMQESNVFFSGSVKIFKTSFPYFYPANVHTDAKGTDINPQTHPFKKLPYQMRYYFKGTVSKQEYEKMLKETWFGFDVPEFTSYNQGIGLVFPYWSSKAITEIMMITSLSKFMRAQESQTKQLIK